MPNMMTVLKDEMIRLARKEIRREISTLKDASARSRHELAELKRKVTEQQRIIAVLSTRTGAPAVQKTVPDEISGKRRISAKGFRSFRKKTGLTVAEMGQLLGVSSITIYNWETGKARPRTRYIAEISALRGMSKKDVRNRLNTLNGGGKD